MEGSFGKCNANVLGISYIMPTGIITLLIPGGSVDSRHHELIPYSCIPGIGSVSRIFRSAKWQNESSPNFSNFCPEICSEFSPKFSRSFRASFPRKRISKIVHPPKNPRPFSMQDSQANTTKIFTVFPGEQAN